MQVELKALLRDRGITAIFVTHDQEEALGVSDRIAVMNAGRIEQFADPSTLYARPRSPFVMDFVGLSTRFNGVVTSRDADTITVKTAVREQVKDGPDLCMGSHFTYGPRRGYHRIVDAFARHNVEATFSTCGRAAERLPWLLQDAVARGHEISCHGWRWERHAGMDWFEEAAIIARTLRAITDACGIAPVGWHTRSASSVNTRALLIDHGGFGDDSDAYDDDMPRLVGDHVILPYAFDTNDMRFSPGGGFVQARDFSDYVTGAFDRLLAEDQKAPRMMSIGLHLRLIGKAGRITGLETVLDHIASAENVWIASRREIADCWRSQAGGAR